MKPFTFPRRVTALSLPRTRRGRRRPLAELSICRLEVLETRHMLTPTAVDDSYQMSANTTLSVDAASGVQANDSNPDMISMNSNVVSNPSHGTLTLNSDGSFSYTPTTNFSGNDTFAYDDSDFVGTSNTATVTITINGAGTPIAVNDSYTVLHDRANSISAASGVLANDTDPNNLTLSASVVTVPTHGTLSLNSDGSLVYTPVAGYTGSDNFSYQDSDGTYTSNVATVSLSVTDPNAPMAMMDDYSVVHDRTTTVSAANGVLANDSDLDGDSLSAVLVSGPSDGSLTLNSDGSFSYTPIFHYTGNDSFTYESFDGVLYSAATTASISVTNSAPTPWDDSYDLPNAQTFNVAAPGVLGNDTDPDGDALTASLVTAPSHGTLTLNSDGSFSYTPNAGWVGQDQFVYAASDGLASSNATVTLTTQYSILSVQDLTKPAADTVQTALQILGSSSGTAATAQNLSVGYDSVAGQGDAVIEVAAGLSNPSNPPSETITASLTFNGVAQPDVYFTMSTLAQSDATVHLAEQVDTSGFATGRYPFSMTITSPDMAAPATVDGFVNVVNDSSSPIGKGWTIPGLLQLYPNNVNGVPAGVLLSTGGGQGWYFTQGSGNSYTSPDGLFAFSTLTAVTGGGWQLVSQYGTTLNFNSSGYLTSRVERTTETTTYNYSGALLTSITDEFGRSVNLAYSGGLLSSITDYAGNVTSFAHSGSLLTTITQPDPGGGAPVWTYGYTGNYLTSVIDPTGAETDFAYDPSNRLSTTTLPGGATIGASAEQNYGYGSTDPAYPADLTLQSAVAPDMVDALGNSTGYQTDLLGNPTSITDAYGNVTTMQRDANGLVTQLTQPSPDGVQAAPVTTYSYDSLGNETSATGALSTFGMFTFNSFSEPLTFVDLLNHTTTWVYDAHGNLLSKQDALGNTTTWTYDQYGRPLTMTLPDPDGAGPLTAPEYHYAYDSYERLITITNPDNTTGHFSYDADDRPLSVEDENSHTTTTAYDALGRVTSVTNAAGGVVSYSYDLDGRVLTTQDEMGNVTTNVYNSRGELTSTTLPDPDGAGPLTSPVWSFTYDANADKLTQTDPLGRVTSWAYDEMGRVSTVSLPDPDGAGPLTSPVTTYGYDNLGRKISVTDASGGLTQLAYNSHNWLTSVTAPDPDGSGPLTSPVTTFGYDALGRQTSITDPMGHTTTTAFDADGRKTSVTDNLNHSTTFSYDHDSNLLGKRSRVLN